MSEQLRDEEIIQKLETENAKLRECVKFYAIEDNHDPRDSDYGKRARQVLKELDEEL